MRIRSARAVKGTPVPASTCSACSRTRRATCTWDTRRATRTSMSSRASGGTAATTCSTRSGGTPSASRPRTPRSSAGRSPRVDLREHLAAQEELPRVRLVVRLVAHPAHERPRVLPLEPVAVPEAARAGPGVPQGQPRQLVPERPDRARERAGRRWALRALRRRGDQEEADAVVLQDHGLRRPPAR